MSSYELIERMLSKVPDSMIVSVCETSEDSMHLFVNRRLKRTGTPSQILTTLRKLLTLTTKHDNYTVGPPRPMEF